MESSENIQCPKDLNQYILEHPFENTFPESDCEMRKFYGDCYHCFATAIAKHNQQVKISTLEDLKEKFDLLPDQTMSIQEIQSIIDKSIEKLKARD